MLFDQFGTEIKAYHRRCDCHGRKGEHRPEPMGVHSSNPVLAPEKLIEYCKKRWMIEMSGVLKMCVLSNRRNNKFYNTYAELIFTVMQEFVAFKEVLDSVCDVLLELYVSHVSTDFNWRLNIPVFDVFEDV